MTGNTVQPKISANRKREAFEKLATGQITIAEAVGIPKKQLYSIAQRGYQMLSSGRYEEARQIYAGLVAADPYDSVFHCHLGAALWRLGEIDRALEEFEAALRFNIANIDALAGRGELLLQRGDFTRGIEDLRKAVELDQTGARPASVRARALLFSLCQAVIQKKGQ